MRKSKCVNDALERVLTLEPDVIIMNDYLPPIDSAHAAGLFRETGMPVAIMTICMDAEPGLIHRAFRHGVSGFIHKDEIDTYLIDGIRSIHQGKRFLSPRAQEAYDSIQP